MTNDVKEAHLGISNVNTVVGACGMRWGCPSVNIVSIGNTFRRFDKSIENAVYLVKISAP